MFSDRLKELRKAKGVTQKQAASGSNLTERGYQDYEYNKNKPGFDAIIALADYFEVSTDYLMGCTDDPRRYR